MTTIAKISDSGEMVMPEAIRAALAVKSGDIIEWEITGAGRAEVRRVPNADDAYLHGVANTLEEWASPEDEDAYRGL
jgi:bifunctional DNA-binding transcriptional regulator/antitoxin component of YhaV-PrlF toxin-antitoxin module